MKCSLLAILSLLVLPTVALAGGSQGFVPLVGIPGLDSANTPTFDDYIDALYALAISVAALIAVIQIVIGGAQYMMDDLITSKSAAKERIKNALIGLLIIIAAALILTTINSDLTRLDINAPQIEVDNSVPITTAPVDNFRALCEREQCSNIPCSQLSTNRGLIPGGSSIPVQRQGLECPQLCQLIDNSIYNESARTCGVSTSIYNGLINESLDSINERLCPESEQCITEMPSDEPSNFTVEGDDLFGTTNEDACSNVNGIYDRSSGSCTRIVTGTQPRTAPGIRIEPNQTYLVNDPAIYDNNGVMIEPPASNHAAIITFPNNLRVENNQVDVIINGTATRIGCDLIQPSVCI